jgi:hypothetical protein
VHHGFRCSTLHEGIDVVERSSDDRLRRVVMFFGELSPVQD